MLRDKLHLNCDMGEGLGNEAELMPFIQAANIACGGHAGDEATILRVMNLAKTHQIEIGIHPSYPDRENFGRKKMALEISELQKAWEEQFTLFLSCSQQTNSSVNHIKAHGALYHALSTDDQLSTAFLAICRKYFPESKIYTSPQSRFLKAAESAGYTVVAEGFADRGYTDQGTLCKRGEPKAIIHDAQEMATQVINMWEHKKVSTITGNTIPMEVQTICVHGDHPHTLRNLEYLFNQINHSNNQ